MSRNKKNQYLPQKKTEEILAQLRKFYLRFCLRTRNLKKIELMNKPEAEFKEFDPRLKYGWLYLNLYSIFKPALN